MNLQNKGVIFADISGTTRLYRKIGTSEAQRMLERCVRRIERAIETHGGRILMPAVDEMVACFAGADAAVHAAIDMQQRIADLPPASGISLSIRIGVHFGALVEDDQGVHGAAVDGGRALLALAGPHQILTCARTAEVLSMPLKRMLHSLDDMMLPLADGECQLFELVWAAEGVAAADPDSTTLSPSLPPDLPVGGRAKSGGRSSPSGASVSERFCIRFKGKAYLVDALTPSLTIGRDKLCDIVVHDRKASRIHVRLEKRGHQGFFLVDESMNGTFVAVGKTADLRLHNEEMQLTGSGRIAFGHSTASEGAEIAEFEAL